MQINNKWFVGATLALFALISTGVMPSQQADAQQSSLSNQSEQDVKQQQQQQLSPTTDDDKNLQRIERNTIVPTMSAGNELPNAYYSSSRPSGNNLLEERQRAFLRLLPRISVLRLNSNPFAAIDQRTQLSSNGIDDDTDNNNDADSNQITSNNNNNNDYYQANDNDDIAQVRPIVQVPRARISRAFVSDERGTMAPNQWTMAAPSYKRNPVTLIKSARYDFGLGKRLSPSAVHAYEFGLGKRVAPNTATIHRYDFGLGR